MKKIIKTIVIAALMTAVFALTACSNETAEQSQETQVTVVDEEPAATQTPSVNDTASVDDTAADSTADTADADAAVTDDTAAAEDTASDTADDTAAAADSDTAAESSITRQAAIHTYTSFADGFGYGKLTDYEDSDLYISVSQVGDYAVFYGYSMEGYYAFYPQFFQDVDADGTVKTDYFQLVKEAIGENTYAQVNDTIKGYLQTISGLYYGDQSYWTYFCFIPEDSQEYQQLFDKDGVAKITGYEQSDLYVSEKSVLSYAYYGYTMAQYYSWYESYGYFTVDGVDYYAKLTNDMNGQLYAQVTDDIKTDLQKISLAYWGSEDYWEYFCSVKTEIIPAGTYETVSTDYFKILEAECGHNVFVPVNDTIKEALKYLSSTFYLDEQYWDYWCYTTYEVTGETKPEGAEDYTTLVGTDGEYKTVDYTDSDLYVNLDVTFDYAFNYGASGAYTISQYYSYGGVYADYFIKTEIVEVN